MKKGKVLCVDDEIFNLDILSEYLTEDGYDVVCAKDGREALDLLKVHLDIDVIVLDRMMPNLDGMACMAVIKADPSLSSIPVIMQTAAASPEHIRQGVEAGVFYYLTKPFEETILLTLVSSALEHSRSQLSLKQAVKQNNQILGLMQKARFRFRTLDEARSLAVYIANVFPSPATVVYGLSELMINAIEHGNLGISYSEKTRLIFNSKWNEEIDRRLELEKNQDRYAYLDFFVEENGLCVRIEDQGDGFNYQDYLELSPARLTDPHGRGIATSKIMSFDDISYIGKGNIVEARSYRTQ